MEENLFQQRTDLSGLNRSVHEIRNEIARVIVGQYKMVDLLLIGLLCDGHILIEGVPGVAKTLTAKLLARIIDVDFSRLQFTPDLMPSDVTGTSVFNPREGEFRFKPGPVFSNIVLIDEINRAPAKTQAALFEVMEERQVTVDGYTHPMRMPFIVLATQNPIEQEGTYRLPEAQLDRFLFKIDVKYPSLEEEISILNGQQGRSQTQMLESVRKILSPVDIQHYRTQIQSIITEPKIIEFIARIVHETRNNPALYLGASPRASLAILRSAKANAAIRGRDFVTPEDVVEMAPHVLRHRIILTPEKEMEGVTEDELIDTILKAIEVPR
ncbi:MAG TPA: MoxR family ATPase [Ferruginibacter sp.]|nr:MoxR family ATPase [Ferruginibacter sp.]MBN8700309.1 MoxR family ATPase [Chitinophagales bacterium]HMU72620.1 MoxR family ATPase [Ferruginibacter sp.]HMW25946.1 MoxR family ATPase [Ferruginibacter sp.]HMX35727.1 MoxR family ATPase [Ferruginibacter sp.]